MAGNTLQRVGADADYEPAFNIHGYGLNSRTPKNSNTRTNKKPDLH
jgi:hypothetical protein